MIMAAGLGSRLQPFTSVLPKPLLPLLGIPMLQYSLDQLARTGVNSIALNYHHLPDIFLNEFKKLDIPKNSKTFLSDESKCLLGSAGGIANVRSFFQNGSFFLLNADVLQGVDLTELEETHQNLKKKEKIWITLALMPARPRQYSYREIFLDSSSQKVKGLGELKSNQCFYSGVAILEPEAVQHLVSNRVDEFVPSVLAPAIAKGKVGYHLLKDPLWLDVGTPKLWWEAHRSLIHALKSPLEEHPGLSEAFERIKKVNRQLAEDFWFSKNSPEKKISNHLQEGYFSWLGDSELGTPVDLPKGTVLYANEKTDFSLIQKSGIGFKDIWVDF